MGLVWKQKIGKIWYLTYSQDLGRRRRSLGTADKNLAEIIRAKEENDILLGKYGLKRGPVQKIRFSDFGRTFLDRKKSDGKAKSTIEGYMSTLEAFGRFLVRDEFMHKITQGDVEAFRDARRAGETLQAIAERGRDESPENWNSRLKTWRHKRKINAPKSEKTIRNDLINLKVAFAWAAKNGFLFENPVTDVELPRRVKRAPLYLRSSEYLKLMDAIDSHIFALFAEGSAQSRSRAARASTFKLIVQFYVLTGCRREEGCGIQPSRDLDLESEAPVLRVPMRKPGTYKAIPIGGELRPVIEELLKRSTGKDQLISVHPDSLYHSFKRYAKCAGLSGELTFHSLRHTAGTWFAAQGAGLKQLQDFLGHGDPQSTQIYIHSVNDELRRQLAKLKLPVSPASSDGTEE